MGSVRQTERPWVTFLLGLRRKAATPSRITRAGQLALFAHPISFCPQGVRTSSGVGGLYPKFRGRRQEVGGRPELLVSGFSLLVQDPRGSETRHAASLRADSRLRV